MSKYLANAPLLFGNEWLNENDPVPEEEGRDYGAMLARGEIRLASAGNVTNLQKQLKEAQARIVEISQRLTDATAEAADLKAQIGSIPPDTEDLVKEVMELRANIASMNGEELGKLEGIGPRGIGALRKRYPFLPK